MADAAMVAIVPKTGKKQCQPRCAIQTYPSAEEVMVKGNQSICSGLQQAMAAMTR